MKLSFSQSAYSENGVTEHVLFLCDIKCCSYVAPLSACKMLAIVDMGIGSSFHWHGLFFFFFFPPLYVLRGKIWEMKLPQPTQHVVPLADL